MKRILLSLCCLTIVFSLCSCTQEGVKPSAALDPITEQTSTSKSNTTSSIVSENKSMPEPFAPRSENSGGDERAAFIQPYNQDFYSVSSELMDLVAPQVFESWSTQFEFMGGSRDSSEFSIVAFVNELRISKEEFTNAIHDCVKNARENGVDVQPTYTDEEIQAIYGSLEEINQYFVSEYSILHQNKIYTPEWLYTHSVEEYEAEGLDPQQVRSRISLYENIPFTLEAEEAFSDKLRAFTGQGLETEAPIPPAETTPAPPMAINAETTPLPEGFDPSLFDESPAESAPFYYGWFHGGHRG